ncbi:MAG TPA: DUF3037 domain-containing protein [Acidiferrobacterales bacterium]|nr:DUF3037 domain-containing protein [Acidiferrobacterales bacterium]
MKLPYAYTYTVLRYVHDITTGEFVNVGVALYAPEACYASALCRTTYGRLAKVFPGVSGEHFKSLMRHIQARFEEFGERLNAQISLEKMESVLDLARSILPTDDSSLQWSPSGAGRTDDPSQMLERLYERMVRRYDDKQTKERRTEEDVWRNFKHHLEARRLLQFFQPKKIAVQDDEVDFQYAWKNGVWHCLEPVSFDLSSPDSIKDKAHRWLGQITSISNASDHFRLYLLVGQPQDDALRGAFDNALSILGKIPVDKEIYLEQQVGDLTERIAQEVGTHRDSTD